MTTPSTEQPNSTHAEIAERIIGNIIQASAPAVSPDGARVAFVVTRVDITKNKYFSQVWLADADGSTVPRAITSGDHDGAPTWSPDGRSLAFVAKRADKKGETTLHLVPIDGPGEVRLLATMQDGIGDVEFSPDGRLIAFCSRTQDERYAAEDESWQAPRKVETLFTKLNGEGWIFDRPSHVYVVAADGLGVPRNLTPGPFQHSGVAWLPDSSAIVTSAQRHETWDRDFARDLYLVPVGDGSETEARDVRDLTKQRGLYFAPMVSPDGSTIAFLGHDDPSTDPQNVHIALVSPSGGEHRWITRHLDRTFETTAGTQAPQWLDAQTLVGTAEDRGQTHLYRVPLDGSGPQPLTTGPRTVKAFDARGGTIAMAIGAVDEVTDIFVVDSSAPAGTTPRRLTTFAERYKPLGRPLGWERFAVPTTDGTAEIDAWIMRPADFDPDVTYPVILNVHGGPHTQYGETFFDEAQFQAQAGFVVLMCNPRGGSGREESWGQSILGPHHPVAPGTGWGSVDVEDVLGVVDAALSTYAFCDPLRVGMQGGSYGGYMATWLAGTTGTRFKGICSERAVNNLFTEDYTSDISTIFRVEHGPAHIDAVDEYMRMSPIRWVRDIETPMLIVHSEQDYRCPISQAEELFVAMRLLGKDVTFYRFPGESHELSRSGSPIHRRQRAEIILDFFRDKLS
jgi:dipeptidyl aminopeptidase/acylaminoacyl peptidase